MAKNNKRFHSVECGAQSAYLHREYREAFAEVVKADLNLAETEAAAKNGAYRSLSADMAATEAEARAEAAKAEAAGITEAEAKAAAEAEAEALAAAAAEAVKKAAKAAKAAAKDAKDKAAEALAKAWEGVGDVVIREAGRDYMGASATALCENNDMNLRAALCGLLATIGFKSNRGCIDEAARVMVAAYNAVKDSGRIYKATKDKESGLYGAAAIEAKKRLRAASFREAREAFRAYFIKALQVAGAVFGVDGSVTWPHWWAEAEAMQNLYREVIRANAAKAAEARKKAAEAKAAADAAEAAAMSADALERAAAEAVKKAAEARKAETEKKAAAAKAKAEARNLDAKAKAAAEATEAARKKHVESIEKLETEAVKKAAEARKAAEDKSKAETKAKAAAVTK